jgi:hypothetical protein
MVGIKTPAMTLIENHGEDRSATQLYKIEGLNEMELDLQYVSGSFSAYKLTGVV